MDCNDVFPPQEGPEMGGEEGFNGLNNDQKARQSRQDVVCEV